MRQRQNETQREREICAAGKLLQVKIRFEEVSFKASFEGREGRVVTESERKRIPHIGQQRYFADPPSNVCHER